MAEVGGELRGLVQPVGLLCEPPWRRRYVGELDEVTAVSPRREIPARVDGVEQTVVGFRTRRHRRTAQPGHDRRLSHKDVVPVVKRG